MKSIPIVLLTLCLFLSFNPSNSSWITSAAGQDTSKSPAQSKQHDDNPLANCEQMASRLFKDNLEASREKFQILSYRHRYNNRLNKCFMLATYVRTPGDPTMLVIYDVTEQSIVGYCGSNAAMEDKNCESQRWKDLLKETMGE
jgi:hypothetical protein